MELIVSAGIGLGLLAATAGVVLSNRGLFNLDMVRTRLNQNLRSSLDIIGMNVREAGENLPGAFPAVELIDGGAQPDQLILRRNLVDEVLKLCVDISVGSAAPFYFAIPGTVPGCTYDDQGQNYNSWSAYRIDKGGAVKAYIYDRSTQNGEFFTYVSETDTATARLVNRGSGAWQADYTVVGNSAAYLIEEWRFQVSSGVLEDRMLQVVENDDDVNVKNIAYGVTNLQVEIELDDGTIVTSFDPGDDWTLIKNIRVTISGEESGHGNVITKSLTGVYFPRNVLSN